MTAPEFLDTHRKHRLAYTITDAVGDGTLQPGIVFLGGFRSDMTGTKACWLEDWARERGRAFLRFDYSGHGQSGGAFEDGCIGDWAADAQAAITALTTGPQVLVGSSMGGWIALLLARRMPELMAALVGIAVAPDFTEDRMWDAFDPQQRADLLRDGRLSLPSDYGEPLVITRRLIEDGRDHLVLRSPLVLPVPVRLLQGAADADVAPEVALRLLDHIDCPDARLTLVKHADHRFSGEAELALLGQTLEALAQTQVPEAETETGAARTGASS
jgi:pimeloyl-ACP methyl ester carboxylesterase